MIDASDNSNSTTVQFLSLIGNGGGERTLAYRQRSGNSPGVIFLHGFKSDMDGTKAQALEDWCRERSLAYLRFDYSGHGQSSGEFEKGVIGDWRDDALSVIDRLTDGPQILVGSSMGGWIMLLAALARKKRIAGLLGIASAADATERLIWDNLTLGQQSELEDRDTIILRSAEDSSQEYPIHHNLIIEGRRHLLLDHPIDIDCPAVFVHGMQDRSVPWRTSVSIMERMKSDQARVVLLKNGDHQLSDPESLSHIETALDSLILGL